MGRRETKNGKKENDPQSERESVLGVLLKNGPRTVDTGPNCEPKKEKKEKERTKKTRKRE